jgi:hypothetical protein
MGGEQIVGVARHRRISVIILKDTASDCRFLRLFQIFPKIRFSARVHPAMNTKILVLGLLSIGLAPVRPVSAQVQQAWVARYNGPINLSAVASAMAIDGAGNVYVTGSLSGTNGASDYLTVKYDANGNQLWPASYVGPSNLVNFASALAIDGGGNVYITGISGGAIATVKYDSGGQQLWAARYQGSEVSLEAPTALAVDSGGDVYVSTTVALGNVGDYLAGDYLTIKYDPGGNELWAVRYDGPGHLLDHANAMAVDGAGNVYVTGSSVDHCGGIAEFGIRCFSDYATVKYDRNGQQLWVARYMAWEPSASSARAIAVDSAGRVYVTGYSHADFCGRSSAGVPNFCPADYATVAYDENGAQLWVARYNGPGDEEDVATAIAVDNPGNVFVTGWSTVSVNGDVGEDAVTIKYDPQGKEHWRARYAEPNHDNKPSAIALDATGNVYIAGSSYGGTNTLYDFAAVKYGANGNQLWVAGYDGPDHGVDIPVGFAVDQGSNIYVTGSKFYWTGTSNPFTTVKYVQTAVAGLPTITTRPQNTTATEGDNVAITVVAAGAEPLSYQWRFNGMDVAGATNATLSFSYVQAVQAGDYSVVVGNSLGITVSDEAKLAVSPSLQLSWLATYGSEGDAAASAIAVDDAGNVYVTGYVTGEQGRDYATLKYDTRGNPLWAARYDGPGRSNDVAVAIAVDLGRNVYVTGYSTGAAATRGDYATLKYDPLGNLLWVARYDGPSHGDDDPSAIAVDDVGNVYVTGSSGTVKYDTLGSQLWVATNVLGAALAIDATGKVYVTGTSLGCTTNACFSTVKYDAGGNQIWLTRYDGLSNFADEAVALAVDSLGNVYVTGSSWTTNTYSDFATLKHDANGDQLWVARYDGPRHAYDDPSAIAVDDAGNVYVTGDSDNDIVTVKYGADGQQIWLDRFDGPAHFDDAPFAMAVDKAANVYITGYLSIFRPDSFNPFNPDYDFALLKYDSDGHRLAVERDGDVGEYAAYALALDDAGNVYIAGYSSEKGLVTGKYVQYPIPTQLASATILTNGQFQFTLTGEAQQSYEIQASSDLMRWTTLTNLFSETGVAAFEAELDGPHRYYRAVKQSAPVVVPIPKLLSPQPDAVLDNGRSDGRDSIIWDFDWSDVVGASQYQLIVKNATALNPVIDVTRTDSFYHYAQYGSYIIDQNRNGWIWKVRARIGGVWGDWSEIRSFDVEPVDADPPTPP